MFCENDKKIKLLVTRNLLTRRVLIRRIALSFAGVYVFVMDRMIGGLSSDSGNM